ncbi:hypothetical protein [Halogeometricum luteum]|nr:hypothetical protein [Halogeometricum sp. S3BR5-2]
MTGVRRRDRPTVGAQSHPESVRTGNRNRLAASVANPFGGADV